MEMNFKSFFKHRYTRKKMFESFLNDMFLSWIYWLQIHFTVRKPKERNDWPIECDVSHSYHSFHYICTWGIVCSNRMAVWPYTLWNALRFISASYFNILIFLTSYSEMLSNTNRDARRSISQLNNYIFICNLQVEAGDSEERKF